MVLQCCGTRGMRAHPHSDPTRAYRSVVFQPRDIHSARKTKMAACPPTTGAHPACFAAKARTYAWDTGRGHIGPATATTDALAAT